MIDPKRKVAIMRVINNKRRFVGKVLGDTLYREFAFTKAVKWATKEVSIDKRTMDVIQTGIRWIIFTDTAKKVSYRIGARKFMNNATVRAFGEGEQYYLPKDTLDKLEKVAKTTYVKDEFEVTE